TRSQYPIIQNFHFQPPDCDVLLANPDLCDGQYYPICATNKKTYANPCFFCSQKTDYGLNFDFSHTFLCLLLKSYFAVDSPIPR
uniref:Kazal-like domain-containing protein n=1 Tax=Equus asinus TaxID=9793 RepID=A0A9L0K5Q1_EQUAS